MHRTSLQNEMGITFIDLFAGIGGFRRGMEMAGHHCIGFCEFDKYAVMSYTIMHLATKEQREYIKSIHTPLKKNGGPNLNNRQKEIIKEDYRNGEWYANDIRTVDAGSMPRADCWCFGFPCQDISIAGNRAGFAGHRSSLFFAVTKLIRDLQEEDRPKYLFIENVKNLFSINRGLDFAKLLVELDEIGYDAEWSLLNSKDFGVPQNRERVFIIGHLRGAGGREVFPLGEADGIHNITQEDRAIHEIAQCLTAGGNNKWQGDCIVKQIGNCMPTVTRDNPNQGEIYDPKGIAPCLSKMDGGGREPLIPISMTQNNCKVTNISTTLTASGPSRGRGNASPVPGVAIPVLTPDRAEKRQNGRRFKEDGDPMFTLTSQDRHGVVVSGVYTKVSDSYRRPPLLGLSRCLKSEQHEAGVIIQDPGVLRKVRTDFGKEIRKEYESGNLKMSRHEFTEYEKRSDGISNTLSTVQKDNLLDEGTRIRRLTPRECFRLQGWEDKYFDRAALVNSESQLYKQAGNGVTVNVISAIASKFE